MSKKLLKSGIFYYIKMIKPFKILIIHPGGIGDMVMFTPALKILKNNFPDAKIDIFTGYTPEATGVFKEGGIINKAFRFDFTKKNLFNKLRSIWQLRKEKYDLSLLPADVNHLKGGIFSFLIGAKVRVVGSYFDKNKHRIDAGIDLLKDLGLRVDYPLPAPFLDFNKEKEFVDYFLARNNLENKVLIGLHPGCDRYQRFKGFKRWPKEYFIELGRKILYNIPDAFIILLGGSDEKESCLEIKNKLDENKRIIIAAGHSLKQETALIDKCAVFVGSDSGLTHAASTTNTALIAIFGPTNHLIMGPRGKNVHIIKEKCDSPYSMLDRRFKRSDRGEPCDCLKKITPDRVFNKVKEILKLQHERGNI